MDSSRHRKTVALDQEIKEGGLGLGGGMEKLIDLKEILEIEARGPAVMDWCN